MIDYVQNEDGSFASLKINNKAVSKSFLNALNTAVKTTYWKMNTQPTYVSSNFGDGAEIDGLSASVWTWCQRWYRLYSMNTFNVKAWGAPISTYDNMRYLFRDLCPEHWDWTD